MSKNPNAIVALPGEEQAIWFLDRVAAIKATPEQTGAYGLIEMRLPPGSTSPPHIHHDEDEAWYVIDGHATFQYDGRVIEAPAGTYIFAPRGVTHSFEISQGRPARILVFGSPSGDFMKFVEEVGERAPGMTLPEAKAPDTERLIAVADRHRIEVLPAPAYHPCDTMPACLTSMPYWNGSRRRGPSSAPGCRTTVRWPLKR